MIAKLIAKLTCRLKGHRRGRLNRVENGVRIFACPRCARETTYKEVSKAA